MKKITLTLFALCMTFLSLNAQNGRIIYVDNIYPSTIYAQALYGGYGYPTNEPYNILFDFDNDWLNDLVISFNVYKTCHIYHHTRCNSSWQFTTDDVYHEGDTLSNNPHQLNPGQLAWIDSPTPEMIGPYGFCIEDNEGLHYVFFRKPVSGGFYYGWLRYILDFGEPVYPGDINPNAECHIQDYAFCTIPDYPLRVGQTSLDDDIAEHYAANIMVYPNPTKDLITIDLPNEEVCQSIEIFSIDGRLLETFPETSQQTTINVENLNAGVYILKIKMADDREFSEKIIKE